MNIIVLGAGFRNKGNEAMLRVIQCELNKRITGVNLYALLPWEEDAALSYASGIVPLNIENQKIKRYLGTSFAELVSVSLYLLKKGNWVDFIKSIISFRNIRDKKLPAMVDHLIGGLDAVVDIHGYAFGDPWSLRSIKIAACWGDYCANIKIPYCFFPQSWGPFEKKGYATEVASMLRKASLYYAREKLSQAELAKALGSVPENIAIAPDTVFRFESGPQLIGDEALRQIGINRIEKPLIGITPNMRIYEKTSGLGADNAYVRLLARLCEHCIEHMGVNVVLIANEINPAGSIRQDDRYLCSLITSMVHKPSACFAFRDYKSAEEVRAIIACLDLLVGSRFHTLVFALSVGVPLVALGWAHKYDGLLSQFGLHDYFCHFGQFEEKPIIDLVDRAWNNRQATAQAIRDTLPSIRSQVDAVFDKVAWFCRVS